MRCWVLLLLGASLYGQTFPAVRLERVAAGVVQCTDIQSPKDGGGRLFLVEQPGRIKILKNGQILPTLFLDLRSKVVLGSETGLLGLAFPPNFAEKQYFYVNYTPPTPLRTVISRFRVSATNPDVADPASEQIILTFNQPFANHNGGGLVFGPDGFLYIGTGDGGSGNDPQGNGQNTNTLLGKMLRIDTESGAATYAVPPSNPCMGSSSYRPEIWALGLRNPWRYSFDRETGDLYIADVGQDRAEEVNFQPAGDPGGQNYGWNVMEGLNCLRSGCNMTGLTLPVMEYTHALGISITGGFVYRGVLFPALRGIYFFSDYGSGRIWGLRRSGDVWQNQVLLNAAINVSTFGEDQNGEIYLARHSGGAGGEIYHLVDANSSPLAVNAASYASSIAREGITTAFGTALATITQSATTTPLPTSLGGTTVLVRDSAGVERPAPLFYVSPTQVNYQIPAETASGAATVTITNGAGTVSTATIQVAAVAPGVFAFDASGQGLAAALIQRVRADGTQPIEAVTSAPINLGPSTDQVFLALFGTGIRGRSALSAIRCIIGGVDAGVSYAGAQGGFVGLDQINVLLPRSLIGRGAVDVVLNVEGIPANTVRVNVQ